MVRHGFNGLSSPALGGTPRVYWGYACPLPELAESLRAPSRRVRAEPRQPGAREAPKPAPLAFHK